MRWTITVLRLRNTFLLGMQINTYIESGQSNQRCDITHRKQKNSVPVYLLHFFVQFFDEMLILHCFDRVSMGKWVCACVWRWMDGTTHGECAPIQQHTQTRRHHSNTFFFWFFGVQYVEIVSRTPQLVIWCLLSNSTHTKWCMLPSHSH